MTLDIKPTERGFLRANFTDTYGSPCSIQESSLATDDCVWLGVDDANPLIMASNASKHGIATRETTGWVPFPIPDDVLLHTRMHLNREQAAVIGRALTRLALRGTLAEPSPEEQMANVQAAFKESEMLDRENVKDFEADFRLALTEDDPGEYDNGDGLTYKDIDRIVSIAAASLENIIAGGSRAIETMRADMKALRARAEDAEGRIANALL